MEKFAEFIIKFLAVCAFLGSFILNLMFWAWLGFHFFGEFGGFISMILGVIAYIVAMDVFLKE